MFAIAWRIRAEPFKYTKSEMVFDIPQLLVYVDK